MTDHPPADPVSCRCIDEGLFPGPTPHLIRAYACGYLARVPIAEHDIYGIAAGSDQGKRLHQQLRATADRLHRRDTGHGD